MWLTLLLCLRFELECLESERINLPIPPLLYTIIYTPFCNS